MRDCYFLTDQTHFWFVWLLCFVQSFYFLSFYSSVFVASFLFLLLLLLGVLCWFFGVVCFLSACFCFLIMVLFFFILYGKGRLLLYLVFVCFGSCFGIIYGFFVVFLLCLCFFVVVVFCVLGCCVFLILVLFVCFIYAGTSVLCLVLLFNVPWEFFVCVSRWLSRIRLKIGSLTFWIILRTVCECGCAYGWIRGIVIQHKF